MNSQYGENSEFLDVTAVGVYIYHRDLSGPIY
jgi:hypothetical protein